MAGFSLLTAGGLAAEQSEDSKGSAPEGSGQWSRDSGGAAPACLPAKLGSPYIPVDSSLYPAVMRLYSMGFVDDVYLGMRPWTRASIGHMLETAGARIDDVDPGPATDVVRVGIQKLVQCLLDRCSNHLVQMRLNAPFVDLHHRPWHRLHPASRPQSRFHGWLRRSCLRGLAPPACTNLQRIKPNSNVRKISYVILSGRSPHLSSFEVLTEGPCSQVRHSWNCASAQEREDRPRQSVLSEMSTHNEKPG
jgi:hypothetical protein